MAKKDEFEPRRAEPGQEFTYNDANGEAIEFKADDAGIVRPKNAAQSQAADAFGLPVARKITAEEKAATEAAEAEKENG